MKNNSGDVSKKITVCGLCGLLMAATLSGFICVNPKCPAYMCENRQHLLEKGNTGTSYIYTPTISVRGTSASATTTTTIYPYLNGFDKGGGR